MVEDIVRNVVNNYVNENCMLLKEFKNPVDAETVRVCADTLAKLHDDIIGSGVSRREVTVEKLASIVKELRRLEEEMR